MKSRPAQSRKEALKKLLLSAKISTQEDLVSELEQQGYTATQSTISRELRKLGAIKGTDASGRTVYRLEENSSNYPSLPTAGFKSLLLEIQHNGSLIVLHTTPGSASLVARHLDQVKPQGILGTIAGDDTIFIAPSSAKKIEVTLKAIIEELSSIGSSKPLEEFLKN